MQVEAHLVSKSIAEVREGYGENWDQNLFRALNDVARCAAHRLRLRPETPEWYDFLKACGVPEYAMTAWR